MWVLRIVTHQCRKDTTMKNRIDSSRQKTSWDGKNQTAIQEFISLKYKDNYKSKHPKLSETEEKKIINSIIIKECRYCHSSNIIKRGKNQNYIQRYYCNECKRRFTPVTGTIFENHKIVITEWIEYFLDLFNYGSTNLISKVNKNSINTSIYWLHKIFLVLREWQSKIILDNKVYIDEMFYKVIKSDIEIKNGIRAIVGNEVKVKYNSKNPSQTYLSDNDAKITWN